MPKVDTTLPSCGDVEGSGFCVDDQDQAVDDIATYVGSVAGTGVSAAEADRRQVDLHGELRLVPHPGRRRDLGQRRAESRRHKPTREKVVTQVTNGGGAMPSFKDTLDPSRSGRRGLRLVRRRQVARSRVCLQVDDDVGDGHVVVRAYRLDDAALEPVRLPGGWVERRSRSARRSSPRRRRQRAGRRRPPPHAPRSPPMRAASASRRGAAAPLHVPGPRPT